MLKRAIVGVFLLVSFVSYLNAHGKHPLLLDSHLSEKEVKMIIVLAEKLLKEEEVVKQIVHDGAKKEDITSIASTLYGEFPLDKAEKIFGSKALFFYWAENFEVLLTVVDTVDKDLIDSLGKIVPKSQRSDNEKIQILIAQQYLPMLAPYLPRLRMLVASMRGE